MLRRREFFPQLGAFLRARTQPAYGERVTGRPKSVTVDGLEAPLQHPVVITVVFHPQDEVAKRAADAVVAHFDKIGMRRSGVPMRAPVRFRSEPLTADGGLAPIAALASRLNVVIVLYGADIQDQIAPWEKLCREAEEHVAPLLAFVVPMETNLKAFPCSGGFRRCPGGRGANLTMLRERAV